MHYCCLVISDGTKSVDELMEPHYDTYEWDWFEIGGRWSGLLRATKGERGTHYNEYVPGIPDGRYDIARYCDCDFSYDMAEHDAAVKRWNEAHDPDMPLEPADAARWLFVRDKTAEEYAKTCATFTTYSVVTPDGTLHTRDEEKDERTWRDNYKARFLDWLEPEYILTVVDYHN